VSERITRREALLGVSITGIMENPDLLLDPAVQREAAEVVKAANAEMARRIGINPAARTTCVKPSGTSSCLLGTSAGIHPHHARRYLRRVQAGKGEAAQRRFAAANALAVEESVWSPLGTDVVLTFCVEPRPGALTKDDLTAVEFLECVRSTQENWVRPGTRPERCTRPWLTHNVSNTVVVRDGEWDAVADLVYDRRDCFTGVSMLPDSGDRDYEQAPLCAVRTLDEIAAAYGAGWRPAARLMARARGLFRGNLHAACEALSGSGVRRSQVGTAARRHWLHQAGECAARHFGNHLKKLCMCMKDLANLALWRRLKASYRPVDYDGVPGEEAGFFVQEPACAGGACLV
jgi:ribonucleoside-diphosphate reductase alpha chain